MEWLSCYSVRIQLDSVRAIQQNISDSPLLILQAAGFSHTNLSRCTVRLDTGAIQQFTANIIWGFSFGDFVGFLFVLFCSLPPRMICQSFLTTWIICVVRGLCLLFVI